MAHRMRSASKNTRSPTAIAGINLLKGGCEAIKYTRNGKPRQTKFRLSDDEQTLSWDGGHGGLTAPVKMARGERRHIKITEILEIMLGMESKIFSLHKDQMGSNSHPMAHVSMTLVLIGSLPSFPGQEDSRKGNFEMRETLDLTFKDEEIFGLWVAALRALMYETEPVFFAKAASPLNTVNQSAVDSILMTAPPDASCGELLRDFLFRHFLLSKCSQVMNVVWIIVVAGCGTWWITTLFGWWDSFYTVYDRSNCTPLDCPSIPATPGEPFVLGKTHYANIAIQIVRGCLTYQVIFMVGVWRFSNLWHLTCSSRESEAGHDLYGRKTDAAWFAIEKKKRLRVTLLLVGNAAFQILLQVFAIIFYSFEEDKMLPGFLSGLFTMIPSILCAAAGGVYSMLYEHELHHKDPDKFPPIFIIHAIEKFNRKRSKYRARQSIQKEVEFMRSHRMSYLGAEHPEDLEGIQVMGNVPNGGVEMGAVPLAGSGKESGVSLCRHA